VSLADALDMVIQDEFIEACSAESALDALEQLHEEIEGMIQGEKTGMLSMSLVFDDLLLML
jgi:hypothetical protein